jgi:hypothetical protein
LTLTHVQLPDAGNISVAVSNPAGSVSSEAASLVVRGLQISFSLSNPSKSNTTFTVSFPTITNRNYVLQYKNSLSESAWTAVATVSGNNEKKSLMDTFATGNQRFYRMVSEVNVAPVLAAIGNQTVSEGNLLSFTASATDADLPAQTLVFSLDAGAPAGASITTGGVFSWMPTEAQGPGTNLVTIRVSDGELDDYETITMVVSEVNVAPVLAAIGNQTVSEGNLLSFTAQLGYNLWRSGVGRPDGDGDHG